MLSGTAAVTDVVPIGYDARNTSIKLMEVQRNCPSRLTITCFNKKKLPELNAAPLPKCPDPSIKNKFELGPELGPSSL